MDTQPLNPLPERPTLIPSSQEPLVAVPTPSASERDDFMRGMLALSSIVLFGGLVALFSLTKSNLEGEIIGNITQAAASVMLVSFGYYLGSSSGAKSQLAQKEKQ